MKNFALCALEVENVHQDQDQNKEDPYRYFLKLFAKRLRFLDNASPGVPLSV